MKKEWDTFKIKEISESITAGATPSTKIPDFWDGDIPWMSSGEINKREVFNTDRKITVKGFKATSTKMIPKESILIALAGQGKTRATVAINKIELCTNQSIAAIIPNKKINHKFLFYNLDNRYSEIRRLSTGDGGRGGLNLKIIGSIKVDIPPLKEQQKIADILSTWDKAIELKVQLIEQKKEQKKGLMQKLLTGEVRLPGLDGEWEEVKLGDIGKTYNGLSGKTKDDFGSGKPYIQYKMIFDDFKINLNHVGYVNVEEGENQNRAKYGDVFFTTSSEVAAEVGMSSVLLDEYDELYLNSFCFGFRFNDTQTLIPEFAQYLFRSSVFRKHTLRLAQGSTRFNLSKKEIMKIKMQIPSLNEQQKIADVLNAVSREVELLSKEVKVLKKQKKGLMQLLLTGKVRVKV
ncbi:restriction endonuclease subunit S [Virgibacillus kekensis]|uniref:Restriction endonuclease subunit S n=1 Tax=Virgibacillus kekensis TaxID=202261 RepID=A0ABV9DK64_9BACI